MSRLKISLLLLEEHVNNSRHVYIAKIACNDATENVLPAYEKIPNDSETTLFFFGLVIRKKYP